MKYSPNKTRQPKSLCVYKMSKGIWMMEGELALHSLKPQYQDNNRGRGGGEKKRRRRTKEVGKRANRWNSLHKKTTLQVNSCHRQPFAPDRPDIDPQVTSPRPEHRHNYIMHEEAIQTTHAASCQSVSTSEKNKSLFLRVCECICSRIHAFSTARSDVFHRLIFG